MKEKKKEKERERVNGGGEEVDRGKLACCGSQSQEHKFFSLKQS